MWRSPTSTTNTTGLGSSLSWSIDARFCDAILPRFDVESYAYFGFTLLSFVSCEELTDAMLRAFATWSANHERVDFFLIGDACAPGLVAGVNCTVAEVTVEAASLAPSTRPLSVEIANGPAWIEAVRLQFDTSPATCYYMDSTVCDFYLGLDEVIVYGLPVWQLAMRVGIYVPAILGALYLLYCVWLLGLRSHQTGCERMLYVAASLSHRWRLIVLLVAIPPLVDWRVLGPCHSCFAFHAVATHAAGRALGLPPFVPGALAPPPPPRASPLSCALVAQAATGSINATPALWTARNSSTANAMDPPAPGRGASCPSVADLALLSEGYPDCLGGAVPGYSAVAPFCQDPRAQIWVLRLLLTLMPVVAFFLLTLLPAMACLRLAHRRQVRQLHALLTQSLEEAQSRQRLTRAKWRTSLRDLIPSSDRGKHTRGGRAGVVPAGGARALARGTSHKVSSMYELEARLCADLRGHAKAEEARWARQEKAARAARTAKARQGYETPKVSSWLAKAGEGLMSMRSDRGGKRAHGGAQGGRAGGGAAGGAVRGAARAADAFAAPRTAAQLAAAYADQRRATMTAMLRPFLTPAAAKTWAQRVQERVTLGGASMTAPEDEADEDEGGLLRAVLPAALAELHRTRAAQVAARALRSIQMDYQMEVLDDLGDGRRRRQSSVADARRRTSELRALAESTFWHELAHAAPSLIDLVVLADDTMRLRLGRALRAACALYVAAAETPDRSVLESGHPRLVGLRYAPLVREEHRPLLLRFLVQLARATEELRTRDALMIVPMRPPPFMGPPTIGPIGELVPPRPTLAQPALSHAQLHSAGAGSHVGIDAPPLRSFVRPSSMGPPMGAPTGARAKPPAVLRSVGVLRLMRPARMLAPQQLATLRQLLRRIAAATDDNQTKPGAMRPGALRALRDLGSVARIAGSRLTQGGSLKAAYDRGDDADGGAAEGGVAAVPLYKEQTYRRDWLGRKRPLTQKQRRKKQELGRPSSG